MRVITESDVDDILNKYIRQEEKRREIAVKNNHPYSFKYHYTLQRYLKYISRRLKEKVRDVE